MHSVILAGGSGTRLWPYSTRATPKQMVPLLQGRSLLELAVARAEAVVDADAVWVCTGQALAAPLASAGVVPSARIIVEPSARDTFAAALLASAVIEAADPDAVVMFLTADHIIEPLELFRETALAAFGAAAAEGALVTMGVAPDHPATGYGYLELGADDGVARRVSLFKEKPSEQTARAYVAAGPDRYLWNSGMFVWRARTFLDVAGALHEGAGRVACELGAAYGTPDFAAVAEQSWTALPRTSVDYGVMEPASIAAACRVLAVPLVARWLDVGSWSSFGSVLGEDESGNAMSGQVVAEGSRGCVVANSAGGHVVALWGCEDLVVVHTSQATLVVPRARAEEVKSLHAAVTAQAPDFA